MIQESRVCLSSFGIWRPLKSWVNVAEHCLYSFDGARNGVSSTHGGQILQSGIHPWEVTGCCARVMEEIVYQGKAGTADEVPVIP